MLVEVVSGNMSVLLEEVGRGEEGGEEGEMGVRRRPVNWLWMWWSNCW